VNKFIVILIVFFLGQNVIGQKTVASKKVLSSDSLPSIIEEIKKHMIENISYNPKKLKYRKMFNRNGDIYEDGYFIKKELVNGKRYIYGNHYNLIYIQEVENYFVKSQEKIESK